MSRPSDSELKLLRHLWRADRLSAREIHEAAGGDANWSYSSTRKTLDRMVEKGLVKVEHVHGIKTFAAAEPKLKTLAALIRDFARNILDTDAPIPAATFVNSKLIDEDEIEELEALLKQLERKNGKKGDGA
ncbi:MAG: BlaI/MecI/CopY family transcriptional regulator [Maricaulaceae bacterium]|jgi:predicted transcriptional regulator